MVTFNQLFQHEDHNQESLNQNLQPEDSWSEKKKLLGDLCVALPKGDKSSLQSKTCEDESSLDSDAWLTKGESPPQESQGDQSGISAQIFESIMLGMVVISWSLKSSSWTISLVTAIDVST